MPIFEYKCLDCDEYFELFFLPNEDRYGIECPNCKSKNVEKLISGGGFIFKGTGFYETDYKKKIKPKEEKNDTN